MHAKKDLGEINQQDLIKRIHKKKLQRFNYDAKEYLGPKKKTIEEPTHKTYKITQI